MPFARDKILINEDTCTGMWKGIKAEYRGLKRLAKEIQALIDPISHQSLIRQTAHFRDAMQALCDEKLAADQKYIDGLRQVKRDMAAFVDSHS